MEFAKLQAAGNDFILLDARNMQGDWTRLSREMCDRHYGIGADGLILVTASNSGRLMMHMLNPDGSEAEICGNGLRCFAKYAIERIGIAPRNLVVDTLAGDRTVEPFTVQGRVHGAKVNMGVPRFKIEDIPVMIERAPEDKGDVDIMPILDYPLEIGGRELSLSFVSVGNPHAVCFLLQPVVDFPLPEIGPKVENHSMFPERVNFEVARVLDREKIEARVWERGAGETLACGTGACAIGVVARVKGHVDEQVDIMLPGGELTVSWYGVGEIYLAGLVDEVFTGEWPE